MMLQSRQTSRRCPLYCF